MTKKRFVKLVMSHGFQRNEAQKIAAQYNSENVSYTNAYNHFCIKESFRRISKLNRLIAALKGEQTE